jgi:hypothetical protein
MPNFQFQYRMKHVRLHLHGFKYAWREWHQTRVHGQRVLMKSKFPNINARTYVCSQNG